MPFSWRIDHDRGLVCARSRGRITLEELSEYYEACFGTPETAGYDELGLGVGAPAVDVSADDFRRVMGNRRRHPSGRPARVALIFDVDASYGAGRIVEAVVGPRDELEVEVFRELQPALTWLGLPEDFDPDV